MRYFRSTLAVVALMFACSPLAATNAATTMRTHAHAGRHALPSCTTRQRRHRHHPHCRVAAKRGTHHSKRAHHKTLTHPHKPHPRSIAPAKQPSGTEAATIARILSTPCQNTTITPEPSNLPLAEEATLCLINQERARYGEQPLRPNPALERAAQGHDLEMVADDYFAHVSPSGETPLQRIAGAGYLTSQDTEYSVGENIAWGTLYLATPQSIVVAWLASPEHLANILEGAYRDTGVAIVPQAPPSLGQGQPGAVYAQEFGVTGR